MKRILTLVLVLMLISCENSIHQKDKENNSAEKSDTISSSMSDLSTQKSFDNVIEFTQFCANQIRSDETDALEPYVRKGILLSPYAFIDTLSARIVGLDELSNPEKQMYYWGIYAGRGDSILLFTSDYLNKFIFNFDLNKNEVEIKTYEGNAKSRGNEMQNIHKLYPNAISVEFYEPPSEVGGMDWNALIFVVHKEDNHFYLKAIVHNQWTP